MFGIVYEQETSVCPSRQLPSQTAGRTREERAILSPKVTPLEVIVTSTERLVCIVHKAY